MQAESAILMDYWGDMSRIYKISVSNAEIYSTVCQYSIDLDIIYASGFFSERLFSKNFPL
jgi:hypothetical protein